MVSLMLPSAQLLFGDVVTPTASFQPGFFHRIPLQKAVQLFLLAPVLVIVIVLQLARIELAHHGIPPTGQLHAEAGRLAAE